MKHLIIYCHPNPASLNHAIKESVNQYAQAAGQETRIRDVYALNFNPVLTPEDLLSFKSGTVPEDIRVEQEHFLWAELITIVHPVWWTGMPAILKGYFDRVLSYGFAYRYGANGLEQMLKGKDLYILNTVGSEEQNYADKGIFDAMRTVAENTFGFTGLRILEHRFFSNVIVCDEETRKGYLESIGELFENAMPNVAHL
ncbi:NAD(P)H dehydrogenase [Pedobacter sp. KBW06]|uniref:NAD(P)H-dependent oxidoreductase n=1 Tax=Pedobacter sp. KBW06 TaxID=2153359 RepID=UPI000F59BBAA|nr:NAD(P)H-dependent oxidoreductase [Pedobacter sp. KBW06]RQO75094.1 NAD(P)H dehydrogenase [Pedobacter sp. KBW06]